jgi:hypothetical protein
MESADHTWAERAVAALVRKLQLLLAMGVLL